MGKSVFVMHDIGHHTPQKSVATGRSLLQQRASERKIEIRRELNGSAQKLGLFSFGTLAILLGRSRAQLAPTGIYCDLAFILSGELNDPTQK